MRQRGRRLRLQTSLVRFELRVVITSTVDYALVDVRTVGGVSIIMGTRILRRVVVIDK